MSCCCAFWTQLKTHRSLSKYMQRSCSFGAFSVLSIILQLNTTRVCASAREKLMQFLLDFEFAQLRNETSNLTNFVQM